MNPEKLLELKKFALKIRIAEIEEFKSLGFGHIGGSLSITDALAVLYGAVMKIDPKNPKMEDRDKLVCSKGHAGPAIYATLALKGFFPYEDTSLAVGIALGDKLKGLDSRTFLVVGDGESDEGQVWEAAMFTGAKKITNLTWLVDENKKQLDGYTKDILNTLDFVEKFKAFGFDAVRINGNDIEQLYDALTAPVGDKPKAIILDTVKGAGVKEVEETMSNHSMNVPTETYDRWLAQLRSELEALGGEV